MCVNYDDIFVEIQINELFVVVNYAVRSILVTKENFVRHKTIFLYHLPSIRP